MEKTDDRRDIQIMTEVLGEYGQFPNNELPLLIYKAAFANASASEIEKAFEQNRWLNSWRNGIYPYHHYHSITHEVLGIYSGSAKVRMGGPRGITLEVSQGDVIVIPAGVAHKNLGATQDFACIGAYPDGKSYDMNYGKDGERPQTDKNIANVDLPSYDPVFGEKGPVTEIWRERKSSVI